MIINQKLTKTIKSVSKHCITFGMTYTIFFTQMVKKNVNKNVFINKKQIYVYNHLKCKIMFVIGTMPTSRLKHLLSDRSVYKGAVIRAKNGSFRYFIYVAVGIF